MHRTKVNKKRKTNTYNQKIWAIKCVQTKKEGNGKTQTQTQTQTSISDGDYDDKELHI